MSKNVDPATLKRRKPDFGTKFLLDHDKVVPLPETNTEVSLEIQVLKRPGGVISDVSLDEQAVYEKDIKIEKISAYAPLSEVKERIAEKGGPAVEEQRLFLGTHLLPDTAQIGQCYVCWMGYGMEHWPPKFIVKYVPVGIEVVVDIPPMRDTSVFATDEEQRIEFYASKFPIFDVVPEETTALDVKKVIQQKTRMPADRQRIFTLVPEEGLVECDNNLPLSTYSIVQGQIFRFMKDPFDENGRYIFDDAYYDEHGFHPRPVGSHIKGPISTLYQRPAMSST